tara:strand:+ start:38 stop:1663 length:1626 start_codon:yes stop_codon:yes gene_type:complete
MNKKIIYICDYMVEHVAGGAELNDSELIKILIENNHKVTKIQSHFVTPDYIRHNKNSFFIISNFINLSMPSRSILKNLNYLIYEHDHKYLKTRNPASYKNLTADPTNIINFQFYKNARAILCQSSFHEQILQKNLNIKNTINLSGNLWSLSILEFIRKLSNNKKRNICSILNSSIKHKNTSLAVLLCEKKNIKYQLISNPKYEDFLYSLSLNKKFMFLPQTPETLSRVVVEARMLGCSVITNNMIGATQEPWFDLKKDNLIDYMIKKRLEIVSTIEGLITPKVESDKSPLVSIITTFCNAEKNLEHFMNNIVNQTIFDKCELIVVDAKSEGKERQILSKYLKKYDNIKYIRLEEKLLPTPCLNMAIKNCNGDFITFAFTDDVKKKDCIEILFKEIKKDNNISLVYGDVLLTNKQNETFLNNSSNNLLSEHSACEFSKQNMIKCLPGPMPLWSIQIHEQCGFFDEESCNYADDWEMWLRSVQYGHTFKKVNKIVGLVFQGGRSQQGDAKQRQEEAHIFYKYKNIFGSNFQKFEPYFKQFLQG